MTVTLEALRTLHRIHKQLSDLRERLERGPKQIRAWQAKVNQAQSELEAIRLEAKNARLTADRKNLDLKSGEGKINELQVKLNAANSNKEYAAFKEQIAAAEMAGSVLSDEILETLERIDELEKEAAEAEKRVGEARAELEKVQAEVAGKAEKIESDLGRLEAELKAAEDKLPADYKVEYDRQVRSKGESALAPMEEGVCGGCYHQIRPNQLNELYMGRPIFCHSCGRLLYLPEGVGPVRSSEA